MKCWPEARDDKTVLLEKIAWLGLELHGGSGTGTAFVPRMVHKMHVQLFAVSAKASNPDVSFLRDTDGRSGTSHLEGSREGLLTAKFFPWPKPPVPLFLVICPVYCK